MLTSALSAATLTAGMPCHILFVRHTSAGDALMRGVLNQQAYDALNLTCTTSDHHHLWPGPYGPIVRQLYYALMALRAQTTKRLVCYFPKETWGPETELCHRMGAITIFEVIDNDRRSGIFFGSNYTWKGQPRELLPPPSVDLWLVSSRLHARMLRQRGLHARAFPHPHTNFGLSSWTGALPPASLDWTKAGIVATNPSNMPSQQMMLELARQCCAAGFHLALYKSTSGGIVEMPSRDDWKCEGAAATAAAAPSPTPPPPPLLPRECEARYAPGPATTSGEAEGMQEDIGAPWSAGSAAEDLQTLRWLHALRSRSEVAKAQTPFYTPKGEGQPRLPAVGLVWDPGTVTTWNATLGRMVPTFFSLNRPQTRQIWWWSLGVPTIGSINVQSSVDLAARAGLQGTHGLSVGDVANALRCLREGKEERATPLYTQLAVRARTMAARSTVITAARDLDVVVQDELRRLATPSPSTGEDAFFQYYGIPCHCTKASVWERTSGGSGSGGGAVDMARPVAAQCKRTAGCHLEGVGRRGIHSLFHVEDSAPQREPLLVFANLSRQVGESGEEHDERAKAWKRTSHKLSHREPCFITTSKGDGTGGDEAFTIKPCKGAGGGGGGWAPGVRRRPSPLQLVEELRRRGKFVPTGDGGSKPTAAGPLKSLFG